MKYKLTGLFCVGIMLLSGCTKMALRQGTTGQSVEITAEDEGAITETIMDDTVYIGEYLDSDVNDPNLEIAKGENGKYIVQIGIYRLTWLDDGIGELTADGMSFTATDAAGNPISGVITIEGETATVTFTDSTWGALENGSVFKYIKASDIPNIQSY